MDTIRKYLRDSLRIIILFLLMAVSICTFSAWADDNQLSQDSHGNYLISSGADFRTFVDMVNKKSERFTDKKVILTKDIEVNAVEYEQGKYFSGCFDGKNHSITYRAEEITNYSTKTSVFPFKFTNGTLKNVKVTIDQCNISAIVDLNNGSIPENVGILSTGFVNINNDKGHLEGVELNAAVKLNWGGDFCLGFFVAPFEAISKTEIQDCSISINYDLASSTNAEEIFEAIKTQTLGDWGDMNDLELYQFGQGFNAGGNTYTNCYSAGTYGNSLKELAQKLNEWDIKKDHSGIVGKFIGTKTGCTATSCYYDSTLAPELLAVCSSRTFTEFANKDSFPKTTEEMKQQSTYVGFDFGKKWSISSEINSGYPYYDPRAEEVTLNVKPIIADKEWNTTNTKDKNKYGKTDTYYYPYCGDDNGVVTGAEFTGLTAEQQAYVEKYGLSISCDPTKDVESAKIDMNFLGDRPVTVVWKNEPTIVVGNADLAEEDGYEFSVKVVDGTAKVTEMAGTENGISEDQWDAYYEKAKDAIQVIMKWCEKNNGFGTQSAPSYENTDEWAIFTAARCGYVPFDDNTYFDRWFANTKTYLQELKDSGFDFAKEKKVTDIAKLALAIESIGYDLRDISSVDLLTALGTVKSSDEGLHYKYEYMIHALKAGGYNSISETFTDEDMNEWALDRASGLKNASDNVFANADNSMGWQPLIYWYYTDEDVKAAIDSAEVRYPQIGQRATGAFCTSGFETQCPTFGNNAWNNAQALLFASEFNVNILDYASGYTKNGNNILDAVFDQINFEDKSYGSSTIPGFFSYDPPQMARGLCSFVRSYERNIKNEENVPAFWVFSDVTVPTKAVNDAILALNDQSTAEQIKAARDAYDALDETHKKIFNAETLRKLLKAENKLEGEIETAIRAIESIPAADTLTTGDKVTVEKARAAYDKLTDEQKLAVSDYYEILRAAELKLQTLENDKDKIAADKVIAAIEALPLADEVTVDSYESAQYAINRVQAQYDALTDAQKALVSNYSTLQYLQSMVSDLRTSAAVVKKIRAIGTLTSENYEKKQALVIEARTAYDALTAAQKKYVTNYADLEQAELFINKQNKDAKVVYVISYLDELYLTTKEDGSYTDGPLKLTEKANNVPTEKIWGDWESYVADARVLFDTLTQEQQAQVTNVKYLTQAEAYLYQLRSDALVKMLKALPDAATVHGQETAVPTETPQPTEAPVQEAAQAAEEVGADFSFSDGSEDVFTEDAFTSEAVQTEEMPEETAAEEVQEIPVQTEEAAQAAEFVSEEAAPEAQAQTTRALTDGELTKIAEAKHAYDQLSAEEEVKFRGENTALVENLEKLVSMALTYEKGQSEYQKLFAAEAAEVYAAVKDDPVDRDSYPSVKAFLDRYAKDYEAYQSAMAGLKVKVGDQEMTFAEVIAALTAQAETAAKDISDAEQADEWIMNLPTAVTKDNIKSVEAELAGISKFMNSMTAEGRSYMWNAKQLELVKTIVADYHIELAGMQEVFKAAMPTGLQTDVLNYKTIQIRWNSVDNADGYIVYRKTADSEWQKIASGVTGVSYKDKTAVTGVTYRYTVSAYSYVWGEFTESGHHKSGVRAVAKLAKTELASVVSNNYKSIRVTWNKVSGANGYRICRSTTKNGKYTCVGVTKKNSATTFLDKTAVTGKVYYYKVRAYRNVETGKTFGLSSASMKAKAVPATPTLAAASTGKTAILEWTKISGADGYQVYRSTSENGKFTRVKTTKKTGYDDQKVKTGRTLYYKVRAYKVVNGKKVYGSFGAVKAVKIR